MTNVELIVRMLEQAGVRWVFGIPSGPTLPLMEAIRRSPSIEYVLTANEAAAGFMASTVGQLTGLPGVCVATLGPGATNLATGVGAAWLDRAPVVAITCNVPEAWLSRRIQMRIDHHALYGPLTKASFGLRRDNVAGVMARALQLACAEPPGPVHLDLPEDVGSATVVSDLLPADRPEQALPDVGEAAATALAEALRTSRRPLVLTGLTFTRSRAAGELLAFVERQQVPFISTLHAKGMLPESHPNWAGVLGRARRSDVQRFLEQADLIIAAGYDPIEINYEEWAGSKSVLHVSTEAADVDATVRMLFNQGGDMDGAIRRMAMLPAFPNDWRPEAIAAHRAHLEQALRPQVSQALAPQEVLDVLRERLPADAILAYDVGAHTHQIATQWRTDLPGTCLATNGWSSMGYGMPAAYAAKLVHPERTVVAVTGDGGFQMMAGELALARRLGLSAPVVVLNDGWLGLMKVKQEHREFPYYGVRLGDPPDSPPHYFGVPCRGVRDGESLREALDWALMQEGPSVIEAFVDAESYSLTVFD